jgi:hypothetical protein
METAQREQTEGYEPDFVLSRSLGRWVFVVGDVILGMMDTLLKIRQKLMFRWE